VDGTRARVTYQKLVTRQRYGLFRCAVGILPSHQGDDTVTVGASVDVQEVSRVGSGCIEPCGFATIQDSVKDFVPNM
jgi:hypothetical protein